MAGHPDQRARAPPGSTPGGVAGPGEADPAARGADAVDLPGLERRLRFLERKHTADRELALGEVRRLASLEFDLRQKLDDAGDPRAIEGRLKAVAKRLAEGRAEVDRLAKAYLDAEAEVSRSIGRATGAAAATDSLRRGLEPLREVIHRLEVRLLELRVEGAGAAGPPAGEPDRKEAILAELRDLRREVRELKGP